MVQDTTNMSRRDVFDGGIKEASSVTITELGNKVIQSWINDIKSELIHPHIDYYEVNHKRMMKKKFQCCN